MSSSNPINPSDLYDPCDPCDPPDMTINILDRPTADNNQHLSQCGKNYQVNGKEVTFEEFASTFVNSDIHH